MDLSDVELHLVDTVADCEAFLRWASTRTWMAVDTETTGLDVNKDRVRLVQFGDAHVGWSIPYERWSGLVHEFVGRYEGEYVAHNIAYDYPIIENSCGIRLPRERCHDTRILAHILRPDRSTALKRLAAVHIDAKAPALQRTLDQAIGRGGGWTWETIPYDYQPYWSYAALDTVLTARLFELFHPQVMSEAPKAYDLEMATAWATIDMSRHGIAVDRELAVERSVAFERYVTDVERWCVEHYGVKPGQNASVIERLMADGVEFTKTSVKTGAFSLDKEVLSEIDHPLARVVLERRQVQKITSTYLRRFLEYSERDGLLHPRINSLGFNQDDSGGGYGVRTGRMSLDTPNLQQLPRLGTSRAGDSVRNCLVAREEHTLLMVDFSQIEARIIAHLTEDPGFIAAFSEGDFFTNIARVMFKDETIQKSDPRRQPIKNSVYARSYGAGPDKFAKTAGVPIETAYEMYRMFDENYPGWRAFSKQLEVVARQRIESEGSPYVRSLLTGRRFIADEDKLYVLMNYLIQGTAAEVFKTKLVELAAADLDEFMCVPVHDEIVMEVPDAQLGDVTRTALSIMNDATMLRVPIEAVPSVGRRWGEKTEVEVKE